MSGADRASAFAWSPQADAALERLWKVDNLSASKIATELGAPSRSSVLGRLNRLGIVRETDTRDFWTPAQLDALRDLYARNWPVEEIAAKLCRTPQAVRSRVSVLRLKRPAATQPRVEKTSRSKAERRARPSPPVPETSADGAEGRPWTDRRPGECAWPVAGTGADTRSCCAPVEPGSQVPYCPGHLHVRTSKGLYGVFAQSAQQMVRALRRGLS